MVCLRKKAKTTSYLSATKNRHVWIEITTRDKLTLLVKFLDFPSSKIFELPKHILKNPKGSLKQVPYNKKHCYKLSAIEPSIEEETADRKIVVNSYYARV